MTVLEFEQTVWEIDGILIRIRAPINHQVETYDFVRRAHSKMSLALWINGRLRPRLGELQVSIIDGNFTHPHGATKLRQIRESYLVEREI